MLKPPRRTASLLLQHMVDKLPKATHAWVVVNDLLIFKQALSGISPFLRRVDVLPSWVFQTQGI